MHKQNRSNLLKFWQESCKVLIPLCWTCGLFLGMAAAACVGDSFFLTMRGLREFTVSIPGLLLITAFPFLFTAAAVFLSQPLLLVFMILVKSCLFGFCAFGIMFVFSSASWLVQWLLMFSDVCTLPLLMWLWLRHADLSERGFARDMAVCTAGAVIAVALDICVVSPFAATLL